MTTEQTVRSLDDPDLFVETPGTIYDAIPPLPPRTEREAEFYTMRDGEMLINLGPQHPSTHGVLRVVLKIDGERVVDLDPVLGYLHRGVEKICENGDWHHAISNCDPLEYIAAMFSEAMPVMVAEKLLDLGVPRRAEYIRVLAWELNRISSHALFVGWLALDLGGLTPILYGFIERDEIVEMLAALTGQRLLFNYLRIGGVNGDLNHDFLSRLGDWMGNALKRIEDQQKLLNSNEIFVARTRGLGVIDRDLARRTLLSGPVLRATGIPYDVRRAHPYSVYPELEFTIPTREEGDSYARYLLHLDEIKQSIHIIDQVLHRMPDGPVMAKVPRLMRVPPGRAYVSIESPRGQYSAYGMSDGSDQPFRLRIHDPSFFNLQAVGLLMPGNLVADTMAIMASVDPIMGGVDK
ncbi:MAG: NADH-quinone oxidoreductase subunit D [Chloroflexi bacterium]|nr:NADH-quinone oxidoreductase subunit D [Chloroflexota bacterium]MBA3959982.1 NADH-quinone oxidoreductase subunit D [Chloroflexota bacterium]